MRVYVPANVQAGIDPVDSLAASTLQYVGNPRTWRTFTRENLARMPAVRRVRARTTHRYGEQARQEGRKAGRQGVLQKDY